MTDVLDGLEASTLADLVRLDVLANFDDDSGPFVTCAFGSEFRHLWKAPVVEHEVDITEAEAGSIELDQDIFGAWQSNV